MAILLIIVIIIIVINPNFLIRYYKCRVIENERPSTDKDKLVSKEKVNLCYHNEQNQLRL